MCLSTVYKNKKVPEDILMNNVMRIECKDGLVVLTDVRWPLRVPSRRPTWWTATSSSGRISRSNGQ